MAATVASGGSIGCSGISSTGSSSSAELPISASVQEKGSRNKRKFQADQSLIDPNKLPCSSDSECPGYEFSAEKSSNNPNNEQCICDLCGFSQDRTDALRPELSMSVTPRRSEVGPSQPREELDSEEFQEADWNDLTESQLEELVLSNLDTIFKAAIKKISACGYSEDVATKAVLRSGLCYGCKDTVSNIVDNTLAFLRNGQDIDSSRENFFEELQELEKYILAEMVCVLREVRPFSSVGDAMWCLLICDMNVSQACAIDGDPLSSFGGDESPGGSSSVSTLTQLKSEVNNSEVNISNLNKPNPVISCPHASQSETPTVTAMPNLLNPCSPLILEGLPPEREGQISQSSNVEKSSYVTGDHVPTASKSSALEERPAFGRRGHSNSSKRESILRQKSLHLEKNYRAYASKGALRTGKISSFGGLILDKKLKSIPDSRSVNLKTSSSKTNKAVGVDESQADGNHNLLTNAGTFTSYAFNPKTTLTSSLPTENAPSEFSIANTPAALPSANTTSALPAATTALSLSPLSGSNTAAKSLGRSADGSLFGIPFDKTMGRWVPQDEKDEMIMKLVPRARKLQNQLHELTEWANQKVMQAARRLSKDKDELKSLRQEKEEFVRLNKEKQTLEENTMKKLSEMENALGKASGQVERANSAVRRLEVENAELRQQMEAAKVRAAESAASCQEVSKREKKTMEKFQSWVRQKDSFQEELVIERRKLAQLHQELEKAKDLQFQLEARRKQEEKAKEEFLMLVSSIRKEREQLEASARVEEDMIRQKAENDLQKYKHDIQKLENDISQLRLKADSSKIAALRRDIDGSYTSCLTVVKTASGFKGIQSASISDTMANFQDYLGAGTLKRERECVMCLSEEMSVVFLPCAHQVVCTKCNELHEKRGMKDCPSCRTPIQRRFCVRYARS